MPLFVIPQKIIKLAAERKIITGIIVAVLLLGSWQGYRVLTNISNQTRYVLFQVQKGTIAVSVSGTGQVEADTRIDIKPKVSGDIVGINVQSGQEVKAGQLLVQLDSRDAQLNLESAKLALDKLKLQQEQRLRGDALNKAQEEGMSALSDFYGEYRAILEGLDNILFGTELSGKSSENNITYYTNYLQSSSLIPARAKNLFDQIKVLHQQAVAEFESAQRGGVLRTSAINSGVKVASETAELIKLGRDAVRALQDFLLSQKIVHSRQTTIDGHNSNLTEYGVTIDDYLQSLLTSSNTINQELDAIENQPLDLRAQELAVLEAQNKLADYFLRASFDGVIGKIDAKVGDSVSSSNVLVVLITKRQLAEIPLNEIDIANVASGQKATITFDALPDLKIEGEVAEVDSVGEVSQGVVTYNVKVVFESEDTRIKPGLSVSADIITETKNDVLMVPNSALKTQNNASFVEVPQDEKSLQQGLRNLAGIPLLKPLLRKSVQTGVSNDDFTEIVSGLGEGEIIVMRTIQANSSPAAAPQSSGFPFGGGGFRR